MRTGLTRSAAMALLAACVAACATAPRYDGGSDRGKPVTIAVTNNNWLDASIYAVSDNMHRVRLGSVVTGSRQRFTLPMSVSRGLGVSVEIQLLGSSQSYRSEQILVNPGDRIEWRIENQLSLSTYRIAD